MAGIKFEISNEASLLQCEQMTNDRPIVVRGTKRKWSEFKNDYPDWEFANSVSVDELFKLRGKLLNVWHRVGKRLCTKYDMEFVTENHFGANEFHYILLLDASSSMKGSPWKNLLDGVKEFLNIRITNGSSDKVTIIVFNSQASYAYLDEDVQSIDIGKINYRGGGTDFTNAFDLVIKTIHTSRTSISSQYLVARQYIIVLMSDGQASYPTTQIATLSKMGTIIHQFWTVALGETETIVLQEINRQMKGVFKNLKDSADLVHVYAEIARN